MTTWQFHGSPVGALSASLGDVGKDVDTQNLFFCQGGTAWLSIFGGEGLSGAYGGLVSQAPGPVVATDGTNAWAAPTIQNLYTYVEAGVISVVNTKDLAAGQADRFTQAMADVTSKVRAKIQSFPGFVVSATAFSVPPELMDDVCWMILGAIQSAYPALGLQDDQKKRSADAWKCLDELKRGELRVSMPPDPLPVNVQAHPRASVIRRGHRSVTQGSVAGLMVGAGRGDRDDGDGPGGF